MRTLVAWGSGGVRAGSRWGGCFNEWVGVNGCASSWVWVRRGSRWCHKPAAGACRGCSRTHTTPHAAMVRQDARALRPLSRSSAPSLPLPLQPPAIAHHLRAALRPTSQGMTALQCSPLGRPGTHRPAFPAPSHGPAPRPPLALTHDPIWAHAHHQFRTVHPVRSHAQPPATRPLAAPRGRRGPPAAAFLSSVC